MTLGMGSSRAESLRLMFSRMVGAASFNGNIFRSLREDPAANGQSLIVLALAGFSFGLGFAFSSARPLFFSTSPGLIFLLTIVPNGAVQEFLRALGIAWIAIASVSAVKNVFGFDSQRSFMTFIAASLVLFVFYGLVVSI